MDRKPLPLHMEFIPRTADQIRSMLRMAGIHRHQTANLNLDQLHGLLMRHVRSDDRKQARQIVILNETGAMRVNLAMMRAIGMLRQDLGPAFEFDIVASRRKATEQLGIINSGIEVGDLETALMARTGETYVVLENEDFRLVTAAMNEIMSGLPHGRSPEFD